MTPRSENAPEARRTLAESIHYLTEQVQTQADALFRTWCLSWRQGTELEIAIALLETTLQLAERLPNVEPAIPAKLLRQQGHYHGESLFRQGRKVDAEEAARCYFKVLQYEPSDFIVMSDLSWICLFQNDVTGSRKMLDDAIDLIENALAIIPADDEKFSGVLRVAVIGLIRRAQVDGGNQDLDLAGHLLRAGLALPHLYQDDNATLRLLFAEVHLLRFESSESLEDLDEAETLIGQTATDFTVDVRHESYRNELRGRMFQAKWQYLTARNYLTESFSAYYAMYRAIDSNSASPSWARNSATLRLADLLRLSYHQFHNDLLLSRGYNFAKEACTAARIRASEWHISGISRVEAEGLFIMGEIQRSRYERFGATPLLDDAVSSFRQSVQMTEQTDADFARRASELSAILRTKSKADQTNAYQRQADLYEARHWVAKMIFSRLPLRRRDYVGCVAEIGHVLWDSGGPLDRVIPLYQRAVDLGTMDFTKRVSSWRSLAQALISRGRNTKSTDDLAIAETYLNMIERLEEEKDSRSTGRLPVVADLQSAYYDLTCDPVHGAQAAQTNYEIFYNSQYDVLAKMLAALKFALFALRHARNSDSKTTEKLQSVNSTVFDNFNYSDAMATCMDLMTRLISDGHDRAQQLSTIRKFSVAPLITIHATQYAGKGTIEVINAFERGRGIFWDRLINRKSQVVALAEKHEELASQYRDICKRMGQIAQPDVVFKNQPQDKFLLESEMNDLVTKIRQQNGFEDFLLPPIEPSKIQTYASRGPVVMLVAGFGHNKGFALVISTASVFSLDLVGYSKEACKEKFDLLRLGLDQASDPLAPTADSLYQVLTWLWYVAAEPVLNKLGFVGSRNPSNAPPRLWWITCNWANRLPLHAAGDHLKRLNTNEPCTVMDRVISSYSPTLKSLMYSRTRMEELVKQSSTTTQPQTALLAAMEETVDRPKLDNAFQEVERVKAILEPQFQISSFTDPPPTKKDVVIGLRKCTIAHLACHGEADPSDPLKSKILLQDWGPKPLRVGFLMRMDMEDCQLAYLSACETAVSKDEQLAEEGLHISGAFQMAGVPNTVATWWDINDREAVPVVEGFYGRLKGEDGRVDVGRAAGALRGALLEMRDMGISPFVWGSYVHSGA